MLGQILMMFIEMLASISLDNKGILFSSLLPLSLFCNLTHHLKHFENAETKMCMLLILILTFQAKVPNVLGNFLLFKFVLGRLGTLHFPSPHLKRGKVKHFPFVIHN